MGASTPPRDLPQVSDSVDPAIRRPLSRVIEEVQRLLEFRGDPLDAALTLRKAIARGLVDSVGRGMTGDVTYVNTFPVSTGGGGDEPDLTPPPNVTGLSVVAGFTQVLVEFDAPTYTQGHGNLQTNIYASKKATTDATLPVFGDAVLVFSAPGALNVVSIPSELNTRWHVWAKYKTVDGVESPVAAGGTNGFNVGGAYPTTGQDIAQLLDVLTGSITESQLFSTLNTRINLIDAADTVAGSVSAKVKAETDARVSAITLARSDFAAADAATLASANSYVTTYAYSKSTVDSSFSALDTTLRAAFATADAATLATANAFTYSRATIDGAIASSASTLTANYGTAISAAVGTEASARAALDGAVQALYTVRTQVSSGGTTMAGGFGLAATATAGGGATIDFGVIANRFYVGAPNDGSAPGIPDALPFIIQATPTTINGVAVPAGTYIRDAFILNGSITNAKIGNAAIDDAKVANLSAAKLTVGDGTVGGDLKSTSFTAGSGVTPGTGWKLTPGGTLYASGAVIYGTIYASAGVFAGSLSAATGTFAGELSAATGTFAGALSAASGTFAGNLSAASGTFAGDLSAAGGSFAGSLTAATGTLGALTIAAGGHIQAGQTAYNTGTGFYLGVDSGTPRFSIGNPAGAHMRWDGTELTINTPRFDNFTVSIAGGNISASVSYGTQSYGSRTATASGGRAPYTYMWIASYNGHTGTSVPEGQVWISGGGGSATASFAGYGGDMTTKATMICIATDANGRVAVASISSSVTHAAFPPGGE